MKVNSKSGQCGRIVELLINARDGWVSLPEILDLKISQYASRILDLRRSGLTIENRTETIHGRRYSWYRLCGGVGRTSRATSRVAASTPSLFGNLGRWRDPEERR